MEQTLLDLKLFTSLALELCGLACIRKEDILISWGHEAGISKILQQLILLSDGKRIVLGGGGKGIETVWRKWLRTYRGRQINWALLETENGVAALLVYQWDLQYPQKSIRKEGKSLRFYWELDNNLKNVFSPSHPPPTIVAAVKKCPFLGISLLDKIKDFSDMLISKSVEDYLILKLWDRMHAKSEKYWFYNAHRL